MDTGCQSRHANRGAAALRLHLGQLPLHAGERNAARRHQAVRLWQGHVDVFAGRLHGCTACDGETVMDMAMAAQPSDLPRTAAATTHQAETASPLSIVSVTGVRKTYHHTVSVEQLD